MGDVVGKIENLEEKFIDLNDMCQMYDPLIRVLIKASFELDKAGVSKKGRVVEMSALLHEKQHKAGIDRVMGFDIVWTEVDAS